MKNTFTIVMADDDLDDQFLIKNALKDAKVPIFLYPVYDGIQLLDFLYKRYQFKNIPHQADVIFLDLNMPLMDGFEALKHIKGNPIYKHIPVYVLTTSRREEDKKQALELGASGFYSKGSSSKEINRIVREVCFECFT
jgi:two-component system response regulator